MPSMCVDDTAEPRREESPTTPESWSGASEMIDSSLVKKRIKGHDLGGTHAALMDVRKGGAGTQMTVYPSQQVRMQCTRNI